MPSQGSSVKEMRLIAQRRRSAREPAGLEDSYWWKRAVQENQSYFRVFRTKRNMMAMMAYDLGAIARYDVVIGMSHLMQQTAPRSLQDQLSLRSNGG